MKHAFTLIEMMIALILTALVFTYLYAVLDDVRKGHLRYRASSQSVTKTQHLYDLLVHDLTQMRSKAHVVHEAGYDRIDFFTDHSLYGIARPWIHYFVSQKERALIRVEATSTIDFTRSNYIGDVNGTYLFADRLATECSSLRFHLQRNQAYFFLKCSDIEPIVATLYTAETGDVKP